MPALAVHALLKALEPFCRVPDMVARFLARVVAFLPKRLVLLLLNGFVSLCALLQTLYPLFDSLCGDPPAPRRRRPDSDLEGRFCKPEPALVVLS